MPPVLAVCNTILCRVIRVQEAPCGICRSLLYHVQLSLHRTVHIIGHIVDVSCLFLSITVVVVGTNKREVVAASFTQSPTFRADRHIRHIARKGLLAYWYWC